MNTPKGNISLIMLFVLAIGSIIGLMSTNFLQTMIQQSKALKDSYQSYYLAKAGIELGTLAVNRYDYGFQDSITGWSHILSNNLASCQSGCNITITIKSRISGSTDWSLVGALPEQINQCTLSHSYTLKPCDTIIYPLFVDQRTLTEQNTSNQYLNLTNSAQYHISFITANNTSSTLWLWLILWNEDRLVYDSDEDINNTNPLPSLFITGTIGSFDTHDILHQPISWNIILSSKFTHTFNYLSLSNIWDTPIGICSKLYGNSIEYPLDTSFITSQAGYQWYTTNLVGIVKKDFALYALAGYTFNTCESEVIDPWGWRQTIDPPIIFNTN